MFGDQQAHRVGADQHEAGLAEIEHAGETDVELKAEREDAVDSGDDRDPDPEIEVELDERRKSQLRLRPRMPCGNRIRVRMRITKPTPGFHRVLKTRVDHSCERPITRPPDQRAEGIADAAEHGGGEQAEDERQAEIGVHHADRGGIEHAGQPASPAATSHVSDDDPLGIDAGTSANSKLSASARICLPKRV